MSTCTVHKGKGTMGGRVTTALRFIVHFTCCIVN